MQRSVEARLQKLEAQNPGPDPWDELNFAQLTALGLILREIEEGKEVTDEMLWNEGVSRDKFETARQSLTPELIDRLAAWCKAHHAYSRRRRFPGSGARGLSARARVVSQFEI